MYIVAAFQHIEEESSEFADELDALKRTRLLREMFLPVLDRPSRPLKYIAEQKRTSLARKSKSEKTVVTPGVYAIAKHLFLPNLLSVVGTTSYAPPAHRELLKDYPCHNRAIREIEWDQSTRTVPNHYNAVLLDGHRYEVRPVLFMLCSQKRLVADPNNS